STFALLLIQNLPVHRVQLLSYFYFSMENYLETPGILVQKFIRSFSLQLQVSKTF
ncbi:hypothetical protein ACJX0J_028157, partial [Zea mays]